MPCAVVGLLVPTDWLTSSVSIGDCLSVEHVADFPSEGLRGERFVQKRNPWLQDAVVDDGFFRVPGHVEHLQQRPSIDELDGSTAARCHPA